MESLKFPITLNKWVSVAAESEGQTPTMGMPFGHE